LRDWLKSIYFQLDERFPTLTALLRRITGRDKLNGVRKRIFGQRNTIRYRNVQMHAVTFDIEGNDNQINIGEDCVLNNVTFYIRGHGHRISIAPWCRFNRSAVIWIEDDHCTLNIGEHSSFESVEIALTEPGSSIEIGDDCMFAYNIEVRCGDSHAILSAQTGQRLNYAEDIKIGDHVWVATRCTILKGVHIARDSVVASSAVVTRPFDKAGIVIAGNPAKQVKDGITWSRERIYDK